jgi:hypothetical protein
MSKWRTTILAGMVGFIMGWVVQMSASNAKIARCHQAVQVLTKGASVQQMQESAKLLSGE